MKPLPAPIPEDVRELALEHDAAGEVPDAGEHGRRSAARARPVSPVRTTDFTAYIASFRSSHKTGELAENQKVELCYMSERHDQVRITGLAQVVTEREVVQEIWDANPLLRSFLVRSTTPSSCCTAMVPIHVRFMREWALEYHDVA